MLRFLLVGVFAQALFIINNIDTVPICTNENTVVTPLFDGPSTVSRLAWPITAPSFTGLVTLNDVSSLEPPTIICMSCPDPPCYPVTICDPTNLFWSVAYNNVVVPPGRMILSRSPNPPPIVAVFFTPTLPASTPPTPSPVVSVSPTGSPSASSTLHPSLAAALAAGLTDVSHCEPCEKSTVVGLSIVLSFALVGVITAGYLFKTKSAICPYCDVKLPQGVLKAHLTKCAEHLKYFDPAVIDRVRVADQPANQVINVPSTNDSEDEVARPESVQLTRA